MNRADVRALAVAHLAELGVRTSEPSWETLLVADGRLRGYRFQFEHVQVFWFFHSRTLELYDADWRLLKLVEPSHAAESQAA